MTGRILAVIVAVLAASARAETIQKWKTPAGTLYFGNRPPAGSVLLGQEETEEAPDATAPASAEPDSNPSSAPASGRTGRVIQVDDGDTVTLLIGREHVRIRLAEIDAPEGEQPYGADARQALAELLSGKTVRLEEREHDRYGRVVARVWAGGVDVNAEIVRRGAAWVYRRYANDPALFEAESEARAARRGIWALPESDREPPWLWRADRRETTRHPFAASSPARQGPIIGNRRSFIYHRPDCPGYGKVAAWNQVRFGSRAAAEAAGFHEARNCP
ncbi:MAG: thermonuclease family protein [Deltaproteobacteria bacterium]|nr:thermonuclease family protein [Deltaproteobacteria bacterium]